VRRRFFSAVSNHGPRGHPSRRRAKSAAPQDEVGDRFTNSQDEAYPGVKPALASKIKTGEHSL